MATHFRVIIIFLALTCVSYSAKGQSLDCGKPPELPLKQQEIETLKGDLEGKAHLLSRLVGTGNLKGAIESERNTIWQSASETVAAWKVGYLSYLFCASVMSDKSLTSEKRMEALRQFQETMERRPRSDVTRGDIESVQAKLDKIENMLEEKNIRKLEVISEEYKLDEKYPLGWVLFYSDGRKRLYQANSNNSGISFDASETKAYKEGGMNCLSKFSIKSGNAFFSMADTCIGNSVRNLASVKGVNLIVEPIAVSGDAAAFVLGMR